METIERGPVSEALEQAQAEIRRLTELTEALMRAQGEMGYGVVIVDGQQVLYANEAFLELSGYSLESLVALPSFFGLVPDEERKVLQERMRRRLMGEVVDDHYTTAIHHRQGHLVTIEAVVKVAHLDARPHVIAIVRDIVI